MVPQQANFRKKVFPGRCLSHAISRFSPAKNQAQSGFCFACSLRVFRQQKGPRRGFSLAIRVVSAREKVQDVVFSHAKTCLFACIWRAPRQQQGPGRNFSDAFRATGIPQEESAVFQQGGRKFEDSAAEDRRSWTKAPRWNQTCFSTSPKLFMRGASVP